MRLARRLLATFLAVAGAVGSAGATGQELAGGTSALRVEPHAERPSAGPLDVRTWVSQTALWPGDRLTYTVEVACAPNVDVLTDDLASEKLVLQGLEVLASDRERRLSSAGGVTYRVRHHLTTYEVTAAALRIGDQTVRYFVRRAGARAEDLAPAGEARVPGAALALRSTLPDELGAVAVRDARPAASLPAAVALARPVGWGLILLSALPVALWAVAALRGARSARRQGRVGQARKVTRGALEELRRMDTTSDAERRAAYGRLDAMLRQHLAEAAGIPAPALTAAEIAARLRAHASRWPAEALGAVLEECERARYGPASLLPPSERFRAGVATAEELLGGPR